MKEHKNRKFSGKKIAPYQVSGSISSEEKTFALLYAVCGLTASRAYYIAFARTSQANLRSTAAYASRLLREPKMVQFLYRLYRYHSAGSLITYNESALKVDE